MNKFGVVALSVLLLTIPAAGQAPPTSAPAPAFRWERPVTPGGRGPNRLALDLPVVERARPFVVRTVEGPAGPVQIGDSGLADLRLYDSAGREVPYLLVAPALPVAQWAKGAIVPIPATKKASGFELDLGDVRQVDAFRVDGLARPFLKRAMLEGSGDRRHWFVLADQTTLFDLPEEKLRRTEVEFPASEVRYLRLTWDDTTSARVPSPPGAAARLVSATSPTPALRAAAAFEARASEPGRSRYLLRLPAPHLPAVAIELASSGGNVLREARVSEAQLGGQGAQPVPLGSALLRRAAHGELEAAGAVGARSTSRPHVACANDSFPSVSRAASRSYRGAASVGLPKRAVIG